MAGQRMESDSYYREGDDPAAIEQTMNDKIAEIEGLGGEVENISFRITRPGDQPWAEARFDYRLPADAIADEIEYL